MGLKLTAWRWLARAAAALPVGPRRFRESVRGRAAATGNWAAWSGARVVWFHAASVGEVLTADPVMRRLRAARPDLTPVLTYTSPSVARWPHAIPAARADYAPAEHPEAMQGAFAALKPALLVFARGDLWPEMLLAAREAGVPAAVIGGSIRPGSRRLGWPARGFLSPLLECLRFVGAVTEGDAARWRALGAPGAAVHVTGDPRHDHVLERISRVPPGRQADGPVLVAGSVDASDIGPLLEALRLVRAHRPDAGLIVVPHDPSLRGIERFRGFANVEVLTSFGSLADEYLRAEIAYVGGGLGRAGRHSVIEPEAFGVPVLAPTARGEALASAWLTLLDDPAAARRRGLAGRARLSGGAAGAIAGHLLRLIG